MARFNKSAITKLEIIDCAARLFLSNGYSNITIKEICAELDMSPGNLTYHYPTKEHLLASMVKLLCEYQFKVMEEEAQEGISSVLAVCLELVAIAAGCAQDEIIRDFFVSAYHSPLCLEIIRENDAERAKKVFAQYCTGWNDERFAEAELLVSGIEYAVITADYSKVSLETSIVGALHTILSVYSVPHELRILKIDKVLSMDYKYMSKRVLDSFSYYIIEENENMLLSLLRA